MLWKTIVGFRIRAPRALCTTGTTDHGKQATTAAKTRKTGNELKTEGINAKQRASPQNRIITRTNAITEWAR